MKNEFWRQLWYSKCVRVQDYILIFYLYLILALFLTTPLFFHCFEYVPGIIGDNGVFMWNLWWLNRAVSGGENPLFCPMIFSPIGTSLAFHCLTLLPCLLSLPLVKIAGFAFAWNCILWATFVFSAFGTFLLAKELMRDIAPSATNSKTHLYSAFIAGFLFSFSPPRFFYLLGQWDHIQTQFFPFFLLFLVRLGRTLKPIYALLAGLTLAATLLTHHIHFAISLLVMIIWFLWQASHLCADKVSDADSAKKLLKFFYLFILVIISSLIFSFPYSFSLFKELLREGAYYRELAYEYPTDIAASLLPSIFHPFWGRGVANFHYVSGVPNGMVSSPGYGILIAGIIAFILTIKDRKARLFWLLALFFGMLSLGDKIMFNGRPLHSTAPGSVQLLLPYFWLKFLPIFSGIRFPARFLLIFILCLSLLIGLAICKIKSKRRRILYILLIFLPMDFLHIPIPLTPYPDPQAPFISLKKVETSPLLSLPEVFKVLYALAEDELKGPVLELPLGLGQNFTMYDQIFHQREMINGYVARQRNSTKRYFGSLFGWNRLLEMEDGWFVVPAEEFAFVVKGKSGEHLECLWLPYGARAVLELLPDETASSIQIGDELQFKSLISVRQYRKSFAVSLEPETEILIHRSANRFRAGVVISEADKPPSAPLRLKGYSSLKEPLVRISNRGAHFPDRQTLNHLIDRLSPGIILFKGRYCRSLFREFIFHHPRYCLIYQSPSMEVFSDLFK